jgi:hypothetical protein
MSPERAESCIISLCSSVQKTSSLISAVLSCLRELPGDESFISVDGASLHPGVVSLLHLLTAWYERGLPSLSHALYTCTGPQELKDKLRQDIDFAGVRCLACFGGLLKAAAERCLSSAGEQRIGRLSDTTTKYELWIDIVRMLCETGSKALVGAGHHCGRLLGDIYTAFEVPLCTVLAYSAGQQIGADTNDPATREQVVYMCSILREQSIVANSNFDDVTTTCPLLFSSITLTRYLGEIYY